MATGDQVEKLEHQQRLALLGGQLAGLTHDLKSPIAASVGAATIVGSAIVRLQRRAFDLRVEDLDHEQRAVVEEMLESLGSQESELRQFDPLEQSDMEMEITSWLDKHAIADSWTLAPALLEAGWNAKKLAETLQRIPEERIEAIVLWLHEGLVVMDAIRTIEVAVTELRNRTTAISDLSRNHQESGEAISLADSLSRAQRLFRHELGQLDFNIELEPESAGAMIPRNLTQVWTNLIGNAIDALGGKGSLRIHATTAENGLIIEVEDNGPGIPPDMLNNIFDPYVTSKPAGKGTGLGLNISQQIVNRTGGEIDLRSQPGRTVFIVRLPCSVEGESSNGS